MLEAGEYLLEGPGKLTVTRGVVEVLGYEVGEGREVIIPVGRSVLARIESGVAHYTGRVLGVQAGSYQRWRSVLEGLGNLESRTLIVGPSDTGKSTLAAWIVNTLAQQGVKPLYATIDVGQNENYCPGFASSTLIANPPFIPGGGGEASRACFVGSFTPADSLPRYLYCASAVTRGWMGPLVVDSDGWVTLWDGVDSKLAVAEALGVEKIILVGLSGRVAEYIMGRLGGVEVTVLKPLVEGGKDRSERRIHRERLVAKALTGAKERGFKIGETKVYGAPVFTGDPVDPVEAGKTLGLRVEYAETFEGSLRVVADPGGREVKGASIVRPGWEKGLLAAVWGGGRVKPGIVTRANYRTGTLYVYTSFEGVADQIELGRARLDFESFTGRAKW